MVDVVSELSSLSMSRMRTLTRKPWGQVVNHVAATSSGNFIPNDSYGPFNSTAQYHPFCWVDDYNNQTNVEQCSLGNTVVTLQDLNTEDPNTIQVFNSWIKGLVADYGFEAIRIDTVKHVRKVSTASLRDRWARRLTGDVIGMPLRTFGLHLSNLPVSMPSARSSRVTLPM